MLDINILMLLFNLDVNRLKLGALFTWLIWRDISAPDFLPRIVTEHISVVFGYSVEMTMSGIMPMQIINSDKHVIKCLWQ